MSTYRNMPALSPEEIRKISENAVAKVAAQKIVTSKSASLMATYAAKATPRMGQVAVNKAAIPVTKSESGLIKRARSLASSVLSQSNGRQSLQASFVQVVKTRK